MSNATIELFYSKTCPKCPAQKEVVKEFNDRDDVKVRLSDVAVKQGRAERHNVRAVPTTVIDGPAIEQKTGFTGVTSTERVETAVEVALGEKDVEALEKPGLIEKLKGLL
ncbi:MAG: thioredoxin family protein [Candidatus Nanohaloarchaea archaeon]